MPLIVISTSVIVINIFPNVVTNVVNFQRKCPALMISGLRKLLISKQELSERCPHPSEGVG